MPEEIEVRCEKLTHTDLDELGVTLKTQRDGSLKIVSEPETACQIDLWNQWNPDKRIRLGDAITCANGVGTDQPDLMRDTIDTDMKLTLTVRLGERKQQRRGGALEHNADQDPRLESKVRSTASAEHNVEQDPRLESRIRLSKLNEISANYKSNHLRKPDLSADIRIRFSDAEYVGTYVNHGGSKTVFIIRRSGHTRGDYDGNILKIRLRTPKCQWDNEPAMMHASKRKGYNILPELYWEGIGEDGDDEYHCWVVERCIPLNQLAKLSNCDKEQCVLATCRVLTQAALCQIMVSDCHYFNLGLCITSTVSKHEVKILDAGSRGLAEKVIKKSDLKKTMTNLWKWSAQEINAQWSSTRDLWKNHLNGTTLEDIARTLNRVWQSRPYLTTDWEANPVPTTVLDRAITSNRESALHEFTRSPQGKILQLIGRSCVEWRGCTWNARLDELCMNVVQRNETAFTDDEDRVLDQLHERITIERTTNDARTRTETEIDAIIVFWWHLQERRAAFLRKKHLDDAAEIILDQDEIRKVKRILEDREFWYDLTPKQQKEHRPSTYNAMLHNRCGWSTASNAIIQYKLPQLPYMSADDDIRQHLQRVDRFCCDLLTWLKRFAEAVLEKKQEEEKNKRKKKKKSGIR